MPKHARSSDDIQEPVHKKLAKWVPEKLEKCTSDDFENVSQLKKFYKGGVQKAGWNWWPVKMTKGRKLMPPMGVSLIEGDKIPSWKEPTKKTDLLSWVESVIKLNSVLIAMEFEQEGKIRSRMKADRQFVVTINNVPVCADRFFASTLIFGSWTLYGKMLVFMKQNKYNTVVRNTDVLRYIMTNVVDAYIKKHAATPLGIFNTYKRVVVLIKTILEVFWRYDKHTKEFDLTPTSEAGLTITNLDSSLINVFKKYFTDSTYTEMLIDKPPKALLSGMDEKLKRKMSKDLMLEKITLGIGYRSLYPIPSFKSYRKVEKDRRVTNNIIKPVLLKERDIWEMMSALVEEVFGEEKWDKVEIDCKDEKRLGAALCLLQIGCGSRALGVIAANEIETLSGIEPGSAMEGEIDAGEREMAYKGLDRDNVIRVKHVTKEKAIDKEVLQTILTSNVDLDEEEVFKEKEKEREENMIDKGIQYYFFDPLRYNTNWSLEKRHSRYSLSDIDKAKCRPSFIFFQLLAAVRKCIKGHRITEGFEWSQYTVENGDRERVIYYVDKTQIKTPAFKKVYNHFYPIMKARCRAYLSTYLTTLKNTATHELRRLYVCYSYQLFASRKMKEIAYAQTVFRHASINSSVFYTSLQIDMTVYNTVDGQKELSVETAAGLVADKEEVMNELAVMKEELGEIRQYILDLKGVEPEVVRKVERIEARLVEPLADGTTKIWVDRIKRAPRNLYSEEELIEKRLDRVLELHVGGIDITRNFLRRLGVNTKILGAVWEKFQREISENE